MANVQVVSELPHSFSREGAPYARHNAFILNAGPGVHNFVELTASAQEAVEIMLKGARVETEMGGLLTGFMSWAVVATGSLTTATRVATTPIMSDIDPVVTLSLFQGTIATANLPAARTILPRSNGIGQTAATPSFLTAVSQPIELAGLPFLGTWANGQSLVIFQENADDIMIYDVAWQAIRA